MQSPANSIGLFQTGRKFRSIQFFEWGLEQRMTFIGPWGPVWGTVCLRPNERQMCFKEGPLALTKVYWDPKNSPLSPEKCPLGPDECATRFDHRGPRMVQGDSFMNKIRLGKTSFILFYVTCTQELRRVYLMKHHQLSQWWYEHLKPIIPVLECVKGLIKQEIFKYYANK